jgi:iron complex outermembrane receptor protein
LASAIAVAATSFGGLASAADPATTAASSDSTATVGGVVVTARRRAEDVQKVPQSISAFSQRMLTEQSITTPQDLGKAVLSLNVSPDSANAEVTTFAIRGKGQNFGAAAGSVETYFADVPLSGPFEAPTLPIQFFDLQSLQVLNGPQGTLFGRSTTGGTVLLVPQAPTDHFGGYLRLQGGTYNDFQAEGAINLPLGDKAALRLAGFDWQRKGWLCQAKLTKR